MLILKLNRISKRGPSPQTEFLNKLVSGIGFSPVLRQDINFIVADLLLFGNRLEVNSNQNTKLSDKNVGFKMPSVKCNSFFPGRNVLHYGLMSVALVKTWPLTAKRFADGEQQKLSYVMFS